MDPSTPNGSFLLFLVLVLASGLLSGLRNVLSHFQHQFETLQASRGERSSDADLIEKSHKAWHHPGFFESLSLGRYLLDLMAGYQGLFFFHSLGLGWWSALAWTMVLGYFPAHWLIPTLSQAYAHKLGPLALGLHGFYRILLMGGIGEALAKLNGLVLARLGFDPKLSFLDKDQIQQLGGLLPEDENPDRSGLKEDEKEMIRSIFDLRETQAKEVMTPRVDVIALDIKAGWQEVIDLITHEKFSRIPVYDGDMDHVQGILHVMDLMGLDRRGAPDNFRLTEFLRETYFVPRTKKIGDLMREFRLKHVHMAIVVDEYGGTAGIITLEDILEEIVGEIHDEDETEDLKINPLGEGVFDIDPITSLDEVHKVLELDLKPDDDEVEIDTLGGFLLYVHGKVPEQGDVIRYRHVIFEVTAMSGKKMEKIRLTVLSHHDKNASERMPATDKIPIDKIEAEKVSTSATP